MKSFTNDVQYNYEQTFFFERVRCMSHIPQNVVPLFEAGIYLPILLTIVNQDMECVQHGEFKLKEPYIQLLDGVRIQMEKDLEDTKRQFKQKNMKLKRGKKDKLFTEFYFYYNEIFELRRYSNIRLRNQSEFLLKRYLDHNEPNLKA